MIRHRRRIPLSEKYRLQDERDFKRICEETQNAVFGNHANKLTAIKQVVDQSREGSLSDAEALQMAETLFANKTQMTSSEYFEAVEMLNVVFMNNLENGVANDFYNKYWVFNPNKD